MTVRAIAVDHGSAGVATAQPVGVNARARPREAQRSVTVGDQIRERRPGRIRRATRVVWLDAADSWIIRESSPAPRTVWRTDYTAQIPGAYLPFVKWCRAWRYPAVLFGSACDGIKVLLIHPVRGPLTLSVTAALYEIATH